MLLTFDPNLRPQLWKTKEDMISFINELAYKTDIFMPGINEARILCNSDVPEEIADHYLSRGTKNIIIKLGDKGSYYASKDDSFYVPGFKVEEIIDTVGAGDGFAVGVLSSLREGLDYKDALLRGNAIGAIQLTSIGDNEGLPTREVLKTFMQNDA